MIKKGFLMIFILTLIVSCSKDKQVKGSLSKLDLVGAKGFFISQGSNKKSSSSEANKLFKITEDGYVLEVSMLDEFGNEFTDAQAPSDLINLSNEFLIVVFGYDDVYLVRLSDGAAFFFSEGVPKDRTYQTYYDGEIISQSDNSFIYISREGKLVKLNTASPENLTFETYSASGDNVSSFCADKHGNVAYSGFDNGSNQILRYKKGSGGFETLPGSPNASHTTYWTDFNDDTMFYYNGSLSNDLSLKKIIASPFELVDYGTTDIQVGCGFKSLLKIKNKNRIVALGGCTYIYDLYNPTGDARNISYSNFDLTSIKIGVSSDNYYYIVGTSVAGKSILMKVNPVDDTYELLINGEYDIYKMDVSKSDEIVFNALKLSDGKIVIGEIDQLGAITILDETLENQVLVLERVN